MEEDIARKQMTWRGKNEASKQREENEIIRGVLKGKKELTQRKV